MGMYTELYIGVRLKNNTPKEIVDWLSGEKAIEGCPHRISSPSKTHAFGSSGYFEAEPVYRFEYGITGTYNLTFVSNIKNYEDEWDFLLDTIAPYIKYNGHIGHIRYEEDDLPTVIYHKDGKIERLTVRKKKD